jgi:hypothetical protein
MNMRYERSDDAFLRVAFALMQMVLILVVYGFVYTTMLVVRELIVREQATQAAYLVPVIVTFALPYGFWKLRKLFNKGARTQAAVWSIALSAIAVVILSVFSVNLAGV